MGEVRSMHVEAWNVVRRMGRGRERDVTGGDESCPARFDGPLQRRVGRNHVALGAVGYHEPERVRLRAGSEK
jgi:hypothetical protein